VKPKRELAGVEDAEIEALARLARQVLPGEAPRREASSLLRVGEKVEERRRSRRRFARTVAATATLSVAAAGILFFTRSQALTYRVVNGAMVDGTRIVGGAATEVRFSDGSELSLSQGAETHIATLDAHGGRVSLDEGSARVKIAKLPGAAWTLGAGPYSVRVTGTAFSLHWSRRDEAFSIAMQSGSVVVTGPLVGSGLSLHAGQRCTVTGGRLVVENDGALDAAARAETAPRGDATPAGEAPASSATATNVPAPSAAATDVPAPSANATVERPTTEREHPTSNDAPAPAHELDWRKKAAAGAFGDVIDAAERRGLDTTLATAPLDDLAALADSARYSRRTGIARRTLFAERARFPRSGAAHDAAFLLGRLAEDDGGGALDWYDRYLAESPHGAYASQALGRKMMLVYQERGETAARPIAADYLARFPDGAYAATARKLTAGAVSEP
jgi:hypothetical protein